MVKQLNPIDQIVIINQTLMQHKEMFGFLAALILVVESFFFGLITPHIEVLFLCIITGIIGVVIIILKYIKILKLRKFIKELIKNA